MELFVWESLYIIRVQRDAYKKLRSGKITWDSAAHMLSLALCRNSI